MEALFFLFVLLLVIGSLVAIPIFIGVKAGNAVNKYDRKRAVERQIDQDIIDRHTAQKHAARLLRDAGKN